MDIPRHPHEANNADSFRHQLDAADRVISCASILLRALRRNVFTATEPIVLHQIGVVRREDWDFYKTHGASILQAATGASAVEIGLHPLEPKAPMAGKSYLSEVRELPLTDVLYLQEHHITFKDGNGKIIYNLLYN